METEGTVERRSESTLSVGQQAPPMGTVTSMLWPGRNFVAGSGPKEARTGWRMVSVKKIGGLLAKKTREGGSQARTHGVKVGKFGEFAMFDAKLHRVPVRVCILCRHQK